MKLGHDDDVQENLSPSVPQRQQHVSTFPFSAVLCVSLHCPPTDERIQNSTKSEEMSLTIRLLRSSRDDPRTFHKQHVTHDPHTSRKKFSAQTSSGEQDGGYSDRLHVHSNNGREQNSAMYYIRGNAQWSSDQLHVRSERWLRGSDEGSPATF